MLFTVKKENIIEGLQKAAGIIPTRAGAAYLRSLWIKAEGEVLTIMATDANIEFTGTYPADVKEPLRTRRCGAGDSRAAGHRERDAYCTGDSCANTRADARAGAGGRGSGELGMAGVWNRGKRAQLGRTHVRRDHGRLAHA